MDDEHKKQLDAQFESLHHRHDNHDQALKDIERSQSRVVRMLVSALKFDGKAFMNAWHDLHDK